MKDDECYLLPPNFTFTILVNGTELSKAILMMNGEKIKDIEIEKDELGDEFIKFDVKASSGGTTIYDNSKHYSLGLSGFKSLLSD